MGFCKKLLVLDLTSDLAHSVLHRSPFFDDFFWFVWNQKSEDVSEDEKKVFDHEYKDDKF